MKVRIKKTNEKAVVPYKNYAEDFCYDVVATSDTERSDGGYGSTGR